MWRELFVSARNRGGSAARSTAAAGHDTAGGQEKAVSSPQDWADSETPQGMQSSPTVPPHTTASGHGCFT